MIGQTVSHFEITGELGGGGMGVVYRAMDTKLGRPVALKFISPTLTSDDTAKRRFVHEAQAASALQHHNICTIHEIDETPDGVLFICMDCYEGENLRDVVSTGPRPVDEALDVAIQIAEGLDKAHGEGIVHRDIKPANIMLTTDGVVKVVDFGLAKLAGESRVTGSGQTVGTLAYMSPEQLLGRKVDARTDIWSLGVVIYELLTGVSPFARGEASMYAIEHLAPEPVDKFRGDVGTNVRSLLDRCLAKDPSERYQSANELLSDLRRCRGHEPLKPKRKRLLTWVAIAAVVVVAAVAAYRLIPSWPPGPTTVVRPKIAVLPFINLGHPQDEYFADGITDEIAIRLAGIGALGVISRTSSMQYKASNKSLYEIGEELGVGYVVEGSVRWDNASTSRTGGTVRITPQLIRVADNTPLWGDAYQVVIDSVFEIQSDIAMRVISALTVPLLDSERDFLTTPPTRNLKAFEWYLRARAQSKLYPHDEADFMTLIRLYENAIAEDSTFVNALARMARAYNDMYWHHERIPVYLEKAEQALESARQFEPENPVLLSTEASFYLHHGDYDGAYEVLRELVRRRPHDPDVLLEIGFVYTRQNRWDDAIDAIEQALDLNPRSRDVLFFLANRCGKTGRYDRADELYDRLIDVCQGDDVGEYIALKSWLPVMAAGDVGSAKKVARTAHNESAKNPFLIHTRAWLEALDGNYGDAIELFETRLGYMSGIPTHNPGQTYYNRAYLYELLGEQDIAVALYDSARIHFENALQASSSEFTNAGLGIAHAGLGNVDLAVYHGRRALDFAAGNPWFEPVVRGWLARIYTMVGDYDNAIEQLETILSMESEITVAVLRIDPTWNRLRDHPGFQRLIEAP